MIVFSPLVNLLFAYACKTCASWIRKPCSTGKTWRLIINSNSWFFDFAIHVLPCSVKFQLIYLSNDIFLSPSPVYFSKIGVLSDHCWTFTQYYGWSVTVPTTSIYQGNSRRFYDWKTLYLAVMYRWFDYILLIVVSCSSAPTIYQGDSKWYYSLLIENIMSNIFV